MGARIGFVQPQLAGYGGLESYGAWMIAALLERWPVEVLCSHPVDTEHLAHSFGVDLGRARFRVDRRLEQRTQTGSRGRFQRLRAEWDFGSLTRPYDLLFCPTVGLPQRAQSGTSCLLCHFPVVYDLKVDPSVPTDWLSRARSSSSRAQHEIRSRLASWTRVVCSSQYAQGYIKSFWDREAQVVYPPVPGGSAGQAKGKVILSSGFFSPPWPGETYSYKRQEVLIEAFRLLTQGAVEGWSLHLAGHLLEGHLGFLESLRERAAGLPVYFHPNLSRAALEGLLAQATLYWHGTGFEVNPQTHPAQVEHFGISIAEAMRWGCLPLVVLQGGTPEVVGPLAEWGWSSLPELADKSAALIGDIPRCQRLAATASEWAQRFSLERFRREVLELAEGLLRAPESL